jgi:hypothetical protein
LQFGESGKPVALTRAEATEAALVTFSINRLAK